MYDSLCKLQVWHPPVPSHLSQKQIHSTSCYPEDSNVLCSCSQLVSAPPPPNYQGLSVGHHLLASGAWLQKHGNAMKTSHSSCFSKHQAVCENRMPSHRRWIHHVSDKVGGFLSASCPGQLLRSKHQIKYVRSSE